MGGRAGAWSQGRWVPAVRVTAPTRATACRRRAALRRGLGRGMERPAWRARVLVRVRALPPRPRLGTSRAARPAVPWPCSNAKLVVGLEGLNPDVPAILVLLRLGEACATIVRVCCDAKGGRFANLLPQARFPAWRSSFGFGIGDRFAAVISWTVMYGFLFALNDGIMCSTVISLDRVLLCLKKKPTKVPKC